MKASKEKLEGYIKAKPRSKEHPGYFDDDGNFVRGPFYSAMLGGKIVALVGSEGYRQDIGYYTTREYALAGAKELQAKAQEWLAAGNHS